MKYEEPECRALCIYSEDSKLIIFLLPASYIVSQNLRTRLVTILK
jgi:hypothetical protein